MSAVLRAVVVLLALLPLPTFSATFGIDASDLWFDSADPGWGVNVVQQNEVLFVTIYVYDKDSRPTWYVGSDVRFTRILDNGFEFSGPLYQTLAGSAPRQVGSLTIHLASPTAAKLRYVIDGQPVEKSIVRQTWRTPQFSRSYLGGRTGSYFDCAGPTDPSRDEPGQIDVLQAERTITWKLNFAAGGSCTYAGAYEQHGRLGTVDGTVSCTTGDSGTFTASEVEVSRSGFMGVVRARMSRCTWFGWLGGIYRNIPGPLAP